MLNKRAGYEVEGKYSSYMDELKPFSRNETELQQEMTIVYTFSNDVRMEFGQDMHYSSFQVWQAAWVADQTVRINLGLKTYIYRGHGRGWWYRSQRDGQIIEGILPAVQADSQDGVKLEEKDDGYQHPAVLGGWLKNWEDRLKRENS